MKVFTTSVATFALMLCTSQLLAQQGPHGQQGQFGQPAAQRPQLTRVEQIAKRGEMFKQMMQYRRARNAAKPDAETVTQLKQQIQELHQLIVGNNFNSCPFKGKCEFCQELWLQQQAQNPQAQAMGQGNMQGL